MSDKNDGKQQVPTPAPKKQPLPAVEGVEEVTETDLDNIAGGAMCATFSGCPFTIGD